MQLLVIAQGIQKFLQNRILFKRDQLHTSHQLKINQNQNLSNSLILIIVIKINRKKKSK